MLHQTEQYEDHEKQKNQIISVGLVASVISTQITFRVATVFQ